MNGVQYTLPNYNDTNWGTNTGNVLTQYLQAIADVTLQLTGGSFTLTADVDFGANFGLNALFLKSETVNPASAGVVRLAKTDSIAWRNNANGADKLLTIDASDNLQYASTKVLLSGAVVNADINGSAAIAYSKLALTGSILNADLAGSIAYSKLVLTGAILNADLAGSIAYSKLSLTGAILNADLAGSIAYSKLVLTGSVVNADIGASAAIALSKLAALGLAKALQSNAATGAIEVSAVTNTELGYLSGVTSAIQTQLTAKVGNPMSANLAFSPTTKGIAGTTTNDNTEAGNVGEFVTSVVAATNLPSSNAWGDLTSISLTAGDWDVMCYAEYENAAAGTPAFFDLGLSTTTGNSSTGLTLGDTYLELGASSIPTGSNVIGVAGPTVRFSVSGTTIVYMKVRANYASGTPQAAGRIRARRMR